MSAVVAVRPLAASPAVQRASALRSTRLSGLRVLVAEDDADDAEMIVGVLRRSLAVAEFCCASDGEAALRILAGDRFRPDLILLDLNMPRLDGLSLLRRVRRIAWCAHTPVVILTTSGRASDVLESLRATADDYLIKPDRARDLELRLNAVIDAVRQGQRLGPRAGLKAS